MRADAVDTWLAESAPAAAAQKPGSQAAAVLTQLGLSSGVFLVAVLGFSFLRTRWPSIYVPQKKKPYGLSDKLPTGFFSWLKLVLSVREEDLTVMIGFDLATFLIALKLFVHLSLFMLLFGAAVLVPVNYYAGLGQDARSEGDRDTDKTVLPRDDVFQSSKFSIDHVPQGSPFLSVHAACVWIFSAATLVSLYRGYRMFISARQKFLIQLEKGPQTRTIMVLGIPRAYRDEEKLRQWFERLDIGLVRSVVVVRDARLVERALKHRYHALRRLEDAACSIAARARGCSTAPGLIRRVGASGYSAVLNAGDLTDDEAQETIRRLSPSRRPKVHTGFGGICGPSVDAFDYFKQKFVDADAEVRWLRRHLNARPFGTAFVEFVAQGSANIAAQLILHTDPHTFVTLMAPDPRDVCWPNAPLPPAVKTVRTMGINACYSFLTVFWAVPTAAITTFLSLSALERVAPHFAEWMSEVPLVRLFVEGTLPTVVVASLNAVVPHILKFLAVLEGTRSYSGIDTRSMSTLYTFYIANVLLVVTIAGTLWKTLVYLAQQPADVANVLGKSLPKMSAFFINYILLQGLIVYPLVQLLQVDRLLPTFTGKLFSNTPRQLSDTLAPPTTQYGNLLPSPLLLFTITLVYSTINPIILPAACAFFVIARLVHTYQAFYIFQPRYESGGKLWSMVHRSVLVALMLYQLTMIGLLLSRKAPQQAASLIPLPFITGTFAWYCQKVFSLRQRFLSLDVVAGPPDLGQEEEQLGMRDGAVPKKKAEQGDETRPLLNSADGSVESRGLPTGVPRRSARRMGSRCEPPSTIVRGVLDDEPTNYCMPQFCGRMPQPWFPEGLEYLEDQVRRDADEAYRTLANTRTDTHYDWYTNGHADYDDEYGDEDQDESEGRR